MEYKNYREANEITRIRIQSTFLKKSLSDIQDKMNALVEKLHDEEVPSLRRKHQELNALKCALQTLYGSSIDPEYDIMRERLLKRLKADIADLKESPSSKKLRNSLKKHYHDLWRRDCAYK